MSEAVINLLHRQSTAARKNLEETIGRIKTDTFFDENAANLLCIENQFRTQHFCHLHKHLTIGAKPLGAVKSRLGRRFVEKEWAPSSETQIERRRSLTRETRPSLIEIRAHACVIRLQGEGEGGLRKSEE